MYRSGVATFTLDYGKCPAWLFQRMVKLGREMTQVLIAEYGPDEFIKRIADPVWFQSLGTVLAFDWNASGLTTILTAALKEAIRGQEKDLGIFIAGGKGKTSRKTPDEIINWGNRLGLEAPKTQSLVYGSKMAAKVDSALIQDGFQIYHHSFFFSYRKGGACPHTKRELAPSAQQNNYSRYGVGAWTVVQQGMNLGNQTARRYHWHSENIRDFVNEPHSGIASQTKVKSPLNLTSEKSEKTREVSTELVKAGYHSLIKDIELLRKHSSELHKTMALKISSAAGDENLVNPHTKRGLAPLAQQDNYPRYGVGVKLLKLENIEFSHHPVEVEDFSKSKYLEKILWQVCDNQPENYEKLLSIKGVGSKTMRALALVSEIIYGATPSYEDPARYSFAHGGKDATPYPIDKKTYDQTIQIMKNAVQKTKLPFSEKRKMIERLL